MKERPILMSAPMVRALLAGTKSQTRLVVKPQPTHFSPTGVPRRVNPDGGASAVIACPYGQPGDGLWVRESFAADKVAGRPLLPGQRIVYRADWDGLGDEDVRWTLSIHMPRWASRITLEVTGVRVERLQDISDADAIAEGIEPAAAGYWRLYGRAADGDMDRSPRVAYRALWESINGPGSWNANPWVWCVEFKKEPT